MTLFDPGPPAEPEAKLSAGRRLTLRRQADLAVALNQTSSAATDTRRSWPACTRYRIDPAQEAA